MRYTVGIGAANVDLHGHSYAPIRLHDSNPGEISVTAGGVTRNILENLQRMGEQTVLLSAVGEDAYADVIRYESSRAGMDCSHLLSVPGTASSSYLALVDSNGDMLAALSDMRVLKNVSSGWLDTKKELVLGASAVVCDPCLSEEALEWLTSGVLGDVPLYADPVSTAYSRRLRPFIHAFTCIKPNLLELEELSGIPVRDDSDLLKASDILLETGLNAVVTSLGSRGCYWADSMGNRFLVSLRPVEKMLDATGAGDAFLAGLIYGTLCGFSLNDTIKWALASGAVAVSGAGTVNPAICRETILQALEEYSK